MGQVTTAIDDENWKWKWSHSVVSDSVTHGLWSARLPHPWDFPGKNTGVGCHFLLQEIFLTQGSNLGLPHYRQTLPSEPPGNPTIDDATTIIRIYYLPSPSYTTHSGFSPPRTNTSVSRFLSQGGGNLDLHPWGDWTPGYSPFIRPLLLKLPIYSNYGHENAKSHPGESPEFLSYISSSQ